MTNKFSRIFKVANLLRPKNNAIFCINTLIYVTSNKNREILLMNLHEIITKSAALNEPIIDWVNLSTYVYKYLMREINSG